MRNDVNCRVAALRLWMRQKGIDAFIFPSTDPHNGEYVPDHWKGREWISGFDGSAGTAVVTAEKAALWTDSRYFIAAEEKLRGTPFVLMRERIAGTPSVAQWLADVLGTGSHRVGLDGMVWAAASAEDLRQELRPLGDFSLVTDHDPLEEIWTDRPPIPQHPIVVHPVAYAGETVLSKLERVREAIRSLHADSILVTALDDIAWTLNLRGTDVHCNPVFVAYLLVTQEKAVLFTEKEKITLETYVQMAYFDRILQKANARFRIMSDNQYEFKRRRESDNKRSKTGLDLDIIDHYNGSERSVETLSGGESFMASLSLALGLSDEIQASSGGIELDTLFVDEGFGTLDEDTLAQAMRALSKIAENDRLVGIISHVSELKEKITKQIVVTKRKTGGSTATIITD